MNNEEIKQVYESMLVEAQPSKKDILSGLDVISQKVPAVKKEAIQKVDNIFKALDDYYNFIQQNKQFLKVAIKQVDSSNETGDFVSDEDEQFFYRVVQFSDTIDDVVKDMDFSI